MGRPPNPTIVYVAGRTQVPIGRIPKIARRMARSQADTKRLKWSKNEIHGAACKGDSRELIFIQARTRV